MKYMLLVYSPENSWTRDEWNQCVQASMGICKDLIEKGQFIAASPLCSVTTGTTVRVREGQQLVTSGPFAETTEQLGGFYLIDVPDLDEAIQVACRLPPVSKGTIEIRPLCIIDGLPSDKLDIEPNAIGLGLSKFMFLCYDDELAWANAGPEAYSAALREAIDLTHQLDSKGQYLSASPLHLSSTATCVRIRNGKRTITDGPFAETREVLGGYYLILAKDQAEAVQHASRHSGARVGAVEVRQVFDLSAVTA